MEQIEKLFIESIKIKNKIIDKKIYTVIAKMGDQIVKSVQTKGKLLICGNGGSAADSQHLVAELLVRLRPSINREALPAICLTMDTSTLTACGNDYGFESIFERSINALGNESDILLTISTSGNSINIIKALKAAKKRGMKCFGFLGNSGGKAKKLCDLSFIVPSVVTGRIQETHITAGHALIEYIEDKLLKSKHIKLKN